MITRCGDVPQTYSAPICIAYTYNKCYLQEEGKKAVKLMKDVDEHLYGWPTMHRYAQMQCEREQKKYVALSPISTAMTHWIDLLEELYYCLCGVLKKNIFREHIWSIRGHHGTVAWNYFPHDEPTMPKIFSFLQYRNPNTWSTWNIENTTCIIIWDANENPKSID